MNKILITGGLGNLGSWLTEHFCNLGFEVWVLTKNFRTLETKSKFHLLHCDLSDFDDIKNKLSDHKFDYVIHAGSVNDGFVENYFKLAIEVNALGTRNLLEYFKDKNLKHFIYFSTFQVYGKYQGLIDENTPTLPINDYGSTHLFGEIYVKQLYATHKIPFTIFRLTNSYGCPKDYNSSKWYLVLNDLSKTAFEKKEIVLKSNGQAPRDFIWMGDVCHIVEQTLKNNPTNDTYNISGGTTLKMIDIANFVQEAYQQYYNETIKVVVNENDKTQYPTDLQVSAEKLRNIISYSADFHFVEEAKKIFAFLAAKKK